MGKCRGAAGPAGELRVELRLEIRRVQVLAYSALEPLECGNECLGDVAATEGTETAASVGKAPRHRRGEQLSGIGQGSGCGHVDLLSR